MALLPAYGNEWAVPMDRLDMHLAEPWTLIADNGYDTAAQQTNPFGYVSFG